MFNYILLLLYNFYLDEPILPDIEVLIGEMSLFEKCLIELGDEMRGESPLVNDMMKYDSKIICEIEILGISKDPF